MSAPENEPPSPHPALVFLAQAWGLAVAALGLGVFVGIIAVVAVKVFRWLV